MQVIGYEYKAGARFQAGATADAKTVGDHLELLRKEYKGELTPSDLISDARNPNSPLHKFFEWDDGAAAEQYRLQQARGLIRSVVAIYRETEDTTPRRTQAYVHINEPGAPHYRAVGHAMSQKDTKDRVLMQAWREFQAFKRKYKDLEEFSALFEKAAELEKTLALTSNS